MIRVLVVDDSAFNRRTLTKMLESDPGIQVIGTAANGEEALKHGAQLAPDVITLDLEMPGMDGFTFLRLFLRRFFVPTIVVSSRSEDATVFKALELGAVDFLAKPTQQNSPDLFNLQGQLVEKVKAVASVRARKIMPEAEIPAEEAGMADNGESLSSLGDNEAGGQPASVLPTQQARPMPSSATRVPLVVVGASTGGPAAIQKILTEWDPAIPAAFLIAVHMPEGFTRTFAGRLNEMSRLQIKEGANGDWVIPGRVLIAPGGINMVVAARKEGPPHIHLEPVGPNDRYIPSVNRLFESVAEVYGGDCLGVVLTGMGDDGLRGSQRITQAGGEVIVESEETAVVFGMPRQVMEKGYARRVLGLPHLAEYMRRWAVRA